MQFLHLCLKVRSRMLRDSAAFVGVRAAGADLGELRAEVRDLRGTLVQSVLRRHEVCMTSWDKHAGF